MTSRGSVRPRLASPRQGCAARRAEPRASFAGPTAFTAPRFDAADATGRAGRRVRCLKLSARPFCRWRRHGVGADGRLSGGCEGSPVHLATSEIVASAIAEAVSDCGLPAGAFPMIQVSTRALGQALVTHTMTAAVGFTGSLKAGHALFDLCTARPTPIPFFGSGSV